MIHSSLFFSIIIPTHNRPKLVINALNSVFNQTYKNFEIIVLNDSSDLQYNHVEDLCKKHESIRYYKVFYKNRSQTRNYGLDTAKGDWVCFLDDDDIYYSNHLYTFYDAIINNPQIKFFHSLSVLNTNGEKQEAKKAYTKIQGPERITINPFHLHSVCINRAAIGNHRFDTNLHYMEDLEYWMRLSCFMKIKTVNEYTNEYIFHGSNTVDFENVLSMENRLASLTTIKKRYKEINKNWTNEKLYQQHLTLYILYLKSKQYRLAIQSVTNALFNSPIKCIPWLIKELKFHFRVQMQKIKLI